jgi:all-trans-8'-apo-beta-carotenal 15,15'-oxygenase
MNRRDFIALGAAVAPVACSDMPTRGGAAAASPLPYMGLATSMNGELAYEARVDGRMPPELRGTLYRDGPGLFERAGYRKQHLLDGDGMIREYRFDGSRAFFRNRFVRTRKYVDESRAGKYLYSTWATLLPGGMMANMFPEFADGQASVSARLRNGRLFAFDETCQPYELDRRSLDTIGLSRLGLPEGFTLYSAHPKEDLRTGDWIHFGLQYGRNVTIHLTEFTREGALKWHRVLQSPRYVYVHDFFVTERYIALYLHPAEIGLANFLLGRKSLLGSVTWKPEQGALLLVVRRGSDDPPVTIDCAAQWMWHSLNAYDQGDAIVADYVGYDNPDSFVGEDAIFRAVMEGREGRIGARGAIRRMVIEPARRSAKSEVLDGGNQDFPTIDPADALRRHRYGYFAVSTTERPFPDAVARMDMGSGARDVYTFGPQRYSAEPIYADGWLLVEVHDGRTRRNELAVLRADRLRDGPVARVELQHGLPLSFHGCWVAA